MNLIMEHVGSCIWHEFFSSYISPLIPYFQLEHQSLEYKKITKMIIVIKVALLLFLYKNLTNVIKLNNKMRRTIIIIWASCIIPMAFRILS